jgi:hypothetical protein
MNPFLAELGREGYCDVTHLLACILYTYIHKEVKNFISCKKNGKQSDLNLSETSS